VAALGEDRAIVLADIPGLIEGASQGAGLGLEFLRHIERTRLLIHLLDGLSDDPLRDYEIVNREMAAFGHGLSEKPQLVAMTKMDLPDAQAAFELFVSEGRIADGRNVPLDALPLHPPAPGQPPLTLPISAASGLNTRELLRRAAYLLDVLPAPAATEPEPTPIYEPDAPFEFEIVRERGGFRVISPALERTVQMTRWDLDDSVSMFQRVLYERGVGQALEQMGIRPGDPVYIGEYELEWGEG
jgi:Predicted GTPase